MKRFLVISLSVLLILPVLLVPCFAVSAGDEFYFAFDSQEQLYIYDGELPSGFYIGAFLAGSQYYYTEEFLYEASNEITEGSYVTQIPIVIVHPTGNASADVYIVFDPAANKTFLIPEVPVGASSISLVYSGPVPTLLDDLFTIAQTVINWCSQIARTIVSLPLLLFTVGIFFVGGCIALFSRFLSCD